MHPLFKQADKLSSQVIGAAMEVHSQKGAGLIESIYERCLLRELELNQLRTLSQKKIEIEYKGVCFEEFLKFDILLEECLLLELKSVEHVLPIHKAQLLSYMKLMDIPLGLLINFHEVHLRNGITRLILPEANK